MNTIRNVEVENQLSTELSKLSVESSEPIQTKTNVSDNAPVKKEKKTSVSKKSKAEPTPLKNRENNETTATKSNDELPIDAYRDIILDKIKSDRVTIIHGETGCGKSSRVPAMLLEDLSSRGKVSN